MKKGTALTVGQFAEINAIFTKALPGALSNLDPKDVLKALDHSGERLEQVIATGLRSMMTIGGDTGTSSPLIRPVDTPFIRFIETAVGLMIPECDGSLGLGKEGEVFMWVSENVKSWGYEKTRRATPPTPIRVGDLVKEGTFREIYRGFGRPLGRLSFTRHQLREFVTEHTTREYLSKTGFTFFLIREDDTTTGDEENDFFVAHVSGRSDRDLDLYGNRLEDDDVWNESYERRFVLPQL